MYRSILVPLDGSTASEHALGIACSIARRADATLRLIQVQAHYQPDPISLEGLPVIDDELRSLSEAHARTYLERVRDRLALETGVPVQCAVLPEDGSIAAVLARDALTHDGGLIIMTTHGRRGFERAWLGSVTDRLIRCSPVPLLVVRPGTGEAALEITPQPRQVLIPLDGSTLAESMLAPALEFARLMQTQIILVRVLEPAPVFAPARYPQPTHEQPSSEQRRAQAQTYLDALVRRMEQHGQPVSALVISAEHAADAILEVARQQASPVIAMATHGRGGLSRLLIGSVADKVLRAAECPVLLHRPEAT
jgi:nucleotide-binding universal stress UspA family protein